MRTKYKPWAKPFLEEHLEVQLSEEKFASLDNIYLEIGAGKGQFLIEMAKKYPDRFFVGIEKNLTCSGFIAKKLVEEQLPNAYLVYGDAEKVLDILKEKTVNIIYLNFSDPWPKVRHHKRRLTSERFGPLYKKVLKDDGYIIQKTDNIDLFEFSIENFNTQGFEIYDIDRDYMLEESDVMTEYEESFRQEGNKIYRMKVRKK